MLAARAAAAARPSGGASRIARRALCTPALRGFREEKIKEVSPFLDASLRGVGQVVFCNSPVSGAAFLGGLAVGDPWLASLAVVGVASSTATARLIGLESSMVASGLAGYNGCLVGCAFAVFLGVPHWSSAAFLATVSGASASVPLAAVLKPLCGNVPQWTWAFNLTTLAALSYVRPLALPTPAPDSVINAMDWASAPLVGFSQVFVVNSPLTGAAILGGIALFSRGCALHTLMGSTVGIATAFAMGAPHAEICSGLWSFNPALTALAISVFFVPSAQSYALALSGAGATAVVFGGLKTACCTAFAVPALTLPFCLVATSCHLLGNGIIPGLVLAKSPHSPEKNNPL